MPQLLFPGSINARALEVGALVYFTSNSFLGDYNILNLSPQLSQAVLVGGIYWMYNQYINKRFELSKINLRRQPPLASFTNTDNNEIQSYINNIYNNENPNFY